MKRRSPKGHITSKSEGVLPAEEASPSGHSAGLPEGFPEGLPAELPVGLPQGLHEESPGGLPPGLPEELPEESTEELPAGLEEACRTLGPPLIQSAPLPASRKSPAGRYLSGPDRIAEVVMVLPRPGGLLLHTKSFYPKGVFRLPTGGIHRTEPVLDAARREVQEETGLALEPIRLLFHLRYPGRPGRRKHGERNFHSLGVLYPHSEAPVVPSDPSEQITEFLVCPWDKLTEVIRNLEHLSARWLDWGRFRAHSHQILLECRQAHPEWFSKAT